MKQGVDELAKDIKRHCDTEEVSVEWDTDELCNLCGYGWEVDEDGLPQCCRAARDEFLAAQKEQQANAEEPPDA